MNSTQHARTTRKTTDNLPTTCRRTARHKLQDLLAGAVLATVLTLSVGSVAYNLATQQQETTQASHTTPSHDAGETHTSEPYARLTPALCVTDYECETADILYRYHTGQLVDNPFAPLADDNATTADNNASEYIPVIEPLDCTGLKGHELAECNTHNTHAGEPVHTTPTQASLSTQHTKE